jgi:hypothetical protein
MRQGVDGGRFPKFLLVIWLVLWLGAGQLVGWQAPSSSSARPGLPSAAEINSILKELSDITGFQIRKQLPFESITREQVNNYLKEQIRRSVKPDEIRAEETTLKKFGFVPPDFDLKQTTIDLLTEQAAAFYDFRRKKLFISDWATANMRDVALIHELAHALADQNFAIEKYTTKGPENSEASLAREAVVEGQASWLMIEVGARRTGRTLADPVTARQLLGNPDLSQPVETQANDSQTTDYPVFNKAPLYLRRTLTFPYDEGQSFQQAVFLHDGKAGFARVFRDAPISTAQIIHPDLYFAHAPLANPDLPKPIRHAKPFVAGAMGELETSILLQQYIDADTARELGPKLKGAGYRVDEAKAKHRMMLVYKSEWSDPGAAEQYFEAYQRVLRSKWKSVDVTVSSADRFTGKSEDGYFAVSRDGNKVLSEEGFEQPL